MKSQDYFCVWRVGSIVTSSRKLRYVWCLVLAVQAGLSSAAYGQVPDASQNHVVVWQSGGGGQTGNGRNNPSRNYNNTQPGPSSAEIERQRTVALAARQAQAIALNDEGMGYYNNGDFESAIDYFKAALKVNSDDKDINQNLAIAENRLKLQKDKEERQGIEDAARRAIQERIKRVLDSLPPIPSAPTVDLYRVDRCGSAVSVLACCQNLE